MVVFLCTLGFSQDVEIVFPDDAGIMDVTKAPYNADSTGQNDATAAIQMAIDSAKWHNRIVYLPHGTYKVSNTLVWPGTIHDQKRTILQGQSRDGTVIRLKDNCEGYQGEVQDDRKAIIYTGHGPAQRFRNSVRNLTIHTGSGNPGACGIQLFASNQGTVRHVKITSGDGNGFYGLDIGFAEENGPFYGYDIEVDGFKDGVHAKAHFNSVTLEKVVVKNCSWHGLRNMNHAMALYDLTVTGCASPVENSKGGVLALVKANLSHSGVNQAAIENRGTLYARDVVTSGFSEAIYNQWGTQVGVDGDTVDEFVSEEIQYLYDSSTKSSLKLPIEELPHVPWGPMSDWGNVLDYGGVADPDIDIAPAVQAAIDAGHKTVYLPGGYHRYRWDGTVYLRGNCHRLIGCEGSIREGAGKIVVTDQGPDVVWVERLDFLYSGVTIEHNSARTLVLSSVSSLPFTMNGSGKAFLADIVGHRFHINNSSARVWARQLNPENNDNERIAVQNHGGQLWILGMKTEGKRMDLKVLTDSGGSTEILGGLIHNNSRVNNPNPIFRTDCSNFSVAAMEYRHAVDPRYHYLWWVEESVGNETKWLDGNFTYDEITAALGLYSSSNQTLPSGGTCGSGEAPPWPAAPDTVKCGLVPDLAGFMLDGNTVDVTYTINTDLKGEPYYCRDAMEGTHSMVFTGGDWVKIDHLELQYTTSSRSVTMWVKSHGTASDTMVLYEEGGELEGIGMRLINGNLEARVRERDLPICDLSMASFPAQTWKHVALVYGDSTAQMYVDGIKVDDKAAPWQVRSHTNGAGLGAKNWKSVWEDGNFGHHLKGQLDDVRFYKVALNPAQVQEIYSCAVATGEACVKDSLAPTKLPIAAGTGSLGMMRVDNGIRFHGLVKEPVRVMLIDARGRILSRFTLDGAVNHLAPVSSPGVVFVRYNDAHQVVTRRVVVER